MSAAGDASRATFREVLAIREFRALYFAQTLSVMGDQLARIAIAVMIFARTGSTTLTGISYAVSYLPWLVGGPTLSVFADRFPRREVMLHCDTFRALLVAGAAICPSQGAPLIALAGLVALIEPPFASARAALIPDVVGTPARYAAASTLGNTTSQVAVVVGFAGGGMLASSLGGRWTLLIDALTFVASAVVIRTSVRFRPTVGATHASWPRQMREGATVVFGSAYLRWLVSTSWVVVGAVIASEAVAVPYARAHTQGSAGAGLLTASLPAGITAGALILGRFIDEERAERLLPSLAVLAPLTLALTGLNLSPQYTALVWFVAGGMSAMSVIANRLFVLALPTEVRGRAFGMAAAGISTAQGVGSLLAGLLARPLGPAQAVETIAIPSSALTLLLNYQWRSRLEPASAKMPKS